MEPKRISVAERFKRQMDLLTGDKKPIPRNSITSGEINEKSDWQIAFIIRTGGGGGA